MQVYTDLLPATKSDPKGAGIDFAPAAEGSGGLLVVKQKRVYTTYAVSEFPTGWDGRAFALTKLTEGSDPTEERYFCFLARNGQDRRCDCKGFSYAGHCKHLSALATLIDAGQL
jgi:hypothetical protein